MQTILGWELRRRIGFTLWWTLGITVLVAMTILSYLAIDDQTQQLTEAFGDNLDAAGAFFGGTDFFSPVGYLSSQLYYIMLPLLVIIMGTVLASNIAKQDEDDLTVEMVLARPVSRSGVIGAKLAAWTAIMVFVAVVTYGVAVLCAEAASLDVAHVNLAATHFLTFAFSMSFGLIAFACIAASKVTRRLAMVAALLLSFGGYVISSLAGIIDQFEGISKFVPYSYFDATALLNGTFDKGLYIYLIGVLFAAVLATYVGYRRRDIG